MMHVQRKTGKHTVYTVQYCTVYTVQFCTVQYCMPLSAPKGKIKQNN